LGCLDIDRRTILKWILKIYGVGCGLDSSASGYEPVEGSCEHNDEPSRRTLLQKLVKINLCVKML
jgi:hypothetical protein